MPREKKHHSRSYTFYALNLRLHSLDRKASEALPKIIDDIRKKKNWKVVNGDSCLVVRNFWEVETGVELMYAGFFTKFTRLSGDWFNLESAEPESLATPKNKFPNHRDADFYLIPSLHRIFIRKTPSVSLNFVIKYLEKVLPQHIRSSETIQVIMEKSDAVIEKILTAKAVRRLSLEITYSNDDDFDDFKKEMDEDLRAGRVGRAHMLFVPDETKNLDIRSSPLLAGLMGVAQSNGEFDSTIVNEDGRREKVRSERFPKIFPVKSESPEMLPLKLLESLRGVFRRARS